MGKKTITMSYEDYQMISVENELYKQQYEELKQEKMVYLTLKDPYSRYGPPSQMSGQMVEKDELLKKMQEHLESTKEQFKDRESNYLKRIERLNEELYEASIKAAVNSTKWWHKLLK